MILFREMETFGSSMTIERRERGCVLGFKSITLSFVSEHHPTCYLLCACFVARVVCCCFVAYLETFEAGS